MSIQARTEGGPNLKFYESAEALQQFEFVKHWLVKQCKKYTQAEPPTAKSLAQLTVQMWQFQVSSEFDPRFEAFTFSDYLSLPDSSVETSF